MDHLFCKESLSCLKKAGVLHTLSSGNGRGFASSISEELKSAIMDEDDAFDYLTLGVG